MTVLRAGPVRSARRLLLLTYHFPPADTPGALRWEKMTEAAVQRGLGVDVITHAAHLSPGASARLGALPEDVRVYGVPERSLWPDRLEEWLASVRRPRKPRGAAPRQAPPAPVSRRPASLAAEEMAWTRTPRDLFRAWWAWRGWRQDLAWARAAATAAGAIRSDAHRAVITCGPPHLVHREGARLARATGLPFVMDLRDPWSFARRLPEHLASPLAFRLAGRAEAECVAAASLVVANTDPLRRAFAARYPLAADRLLTVMNGWDEEPIPAAAGGDGPFRITYAGSVYLDRSPEPVFAAARQVIDRLALTPDDFAIDFLGPGPEGGAAIHQAAGAHGISAYVRVEARRPRHDAMAHLAGSTMLLNLAQDSAYAIPSKVFEYLRFDAWLLALAEPGSPTHDLLRETSADLAAPADIDGIAAILERRVTMYRRGARPGPITGGERFSRAAQAARLFDALEPLISRPTPAPGGSGAA